jgi:aminoglycoside 6'-N-acetyltransferase I
VKFSIRQLGPADHAAVARLMNILWPHCSLDEALRGLSSNPGILPLTQFVAEVEGSLIGFIEVCLRSHVDGCEYGHPVGYLEGWLVEQTYRRRGIGGALVRGAEEWAREHGCAEIGSYTWVDAEPSQRAHQALGYEVVNRCVHFRKAL